MSVVSSSGRSAVHADEGLERLRPARPLVDERPGEDVRVERVSAEGERRHDPEVAAAAAQAPEQVRMLGRTRPDGLAARQHDIGRDEVVDRQAVGPGQPADAAAQRQPRDPRPGHDAERDGEGVRLGGLIDVGEPRAATHADEPRRRVDLDLVQPAQVEHDPVVDGPVAGDVVAAAPDRERQPGRAGKGDRRPDVARIGRLDDEPRPAVDHPVPDAPGVVVAVVVGGDDAAADRAAERGQVVGDEHLAVPSCTGIQV